MAKSKPILICSLNQNLYQAFCEDDLNVIQIGKNKMAVQLDASDLVDYLQGLNDPRFEIHDIVAGSFNNFIKYQAKEEVKNSIIEEVNRSKINWSKVGQRLKNNIW